MLLTLVVGFVVGVIVGRAAKRTAPPTPVRLAADGATAVQISGASGEELSHVFSLLPC